MSSYNDQLDADDQVSAEEWIAAKIFWLRECEKITEDKVQELSQEILKEILRRFAPGFFEEERDA